MSNLRIDNIAPSAGGTYRNAPRGIAAAWVNFNGTSTVAIRDSENVGSITDNGTGDYTVNYTSNMANGNYVVSTGLNTYDGLSDNRFPVFIKANGSHDWSTMAIGSLRVWCTVVANGSSPTDTSLVLQTIHGDLA
jgi:hypothetical protein